MILSTDRVRRKDYLTFTDVTSTIEADRPLEWRRSLNRLSIEVDNFAVEYTHWINNCDFAAERMQSDPKGNTDQVVPTIRAESRKCATIISRVELESLRDSIYRTSAISEADNVYRIVPLSGVMILRISESNPGDRTVGVFHAGSYYGSASVFDESGEIYVDLAVDSESISRLVDSIGSGMIDQLRLNIRVSTFSSEVDDALREPHHRRDLFIHGFCTPAAIESLVIRERMISTNSVQAGVSDRQDVDQEIEEKSIPFESFIQHIDKAIVESGRNLKSLRNPLWVIVLLLLLMLIR